ncbi:MAG: multifunctional oxoglutarate decarboxylase/oxoglutarate dehydrogenase thiamine pyrophosphate-binding subunit/dihydrolipoyllysine-residue succinyltransferase subunit [Acidimicrobiales bacterium]|nr:multifunctional oxoglutarate decarboxylase/oxoglutarate dehydrogenase thiamine pyrophosphate-binding subunit/dihydrolipoyllysine-residue succinyltransferase subunit [Acidimicrobiales bacterium]
MPTVADARPDSSTVGPNAWLVDEMYEQYLADPSSVNEAWRDFFADYRAEAPHLAPAAAVAPAAVATTATAPAPASNGAAPAATPAASGPSAAVAAAPGAPARPDGTAAPAPPAPAAPVGQPLKGAAARIVANMVSSLEVPTATSFREIPAKLLEVNRSVINGYLGRTRGGKVSFTHLIGYAIVRSIVESVPAMNSTFSDADGSPRVLRNSAVNLGIAVDMENADGSRSLMVPVIKHAEELDFREFVGAYEDLIRRVRSKKLTADDLAGATISLTNPGTLGTVQSVPRLMKGQGVIVGVGRIDYPAAFEGADPEALAGLGISKVVTVTSTYDHRIIQGAESGLFLKDVHDRLIGGHQFYQRCFAAIGVPYSAVAWRRDVNPTDHEESAVEKQTKVDALINMYRVRGHLIADLDPLRLNEVKVHAELDPETHGLTIWDLDREFLCSGLAGRHSMTLRDILGVLRDAYCRRIGIEYMHIQEPTEKQWIQRQVEHSAQHPGSGVGLDLDEQKHILGRLNAAEALEKFLATKYIGQKRFGIEGAESAIPLLDAILADAADAGLDSAVLGMAHRGRLNVLVNIVGKSYGQLFSEFEDHITPDAVQGSGDVKYHLGQSGKFQSRHGSAIDVQLAANPSHLEAVDPVVVGMARARMDQIEPTNDPNRQYPVLPVLVHGDAAFAGQGVVAETLNLSNIKGYRVGGTVHLVINNQLGFTTNPEAARSSYYCTDVAKMVQSPIFHVNGDDPEACVRVAHLAFAYRQQFNKDVVIDMVCYRRHGHNEGDDPSYTQPAMYRRINELRSVRKLYTENLVKRGDLTLEDAEAALDDFQRRLQAALDETRQSAPPSVRAAAPRLVGVLPRVGTGVPQARLDRVYEALSTLPEGFTLHPKLRQQFAARDKMWQSGEVDWALGEAFALGTLLVEGRSVRLSGQDSRRGTFSHRHAALIDYETNDDHMPLGTLAAEGGSHLWLYDSLLSEYAGLGFEYGYSVQNKDVLVAWEAQFGDFMNGAQIIIDQFLVAAEDKWGQTSGLVMLLPHGYEGQGPEHSAGRIERFMTLAAEDNIQVANCTTAAQYFHLLRRQLVRSVRKPLIVFTPKSLLRDRFSRSPVEEFLGDRSFNEVLDDPLAASAPSAVRRVILCSGKVAADAFKERDKRGGVPATAIVRVEQLYPWPEAQVADVLARYGNAQQLVWLQEEPENMGAWNGVKGNLFRAHERTHSIERVSRVESGSPASGSHQIHDQENYQLFDEAFAGL